MKKYILDFRVVENTKLHDNYALLKLKPDNNEPLPDMLPGQFVEVRVDRSPGTFLRRPISINFVDSTRNELWLLIRKAGEGTRTLCDLKQGDSWFYHWVIHSVYPMKQIRIYCLSEEALE